MMTLDELIEALGDLFEDIYFTYNGKLSGVTNEVHDYIPKYQVWHGDDIKYYDDLDTLLNDKFYSGKSLIELVSEVEINIG